MYIDCCVDWNSQEASLGSHLLWSYINPAFFNLPLKYTCFISRQRCQLICTRINRLIMSDHSCSCQRQFPVVSVGILSVQDALSMHWKMNWLIGTLRVGWSLMTWAAFFTMASCSVSSLGILGVGWHSVDAGFTRNGHSNCKCNTSDRHDRDDFLCTGADLTRNL